jgi:hypothetical protein
MTWGYVAWMAALAPNGNWDGANVQQPPTGLLAPSDLIMYGGSLGQHMVGAHLMRSV